MKKSSDKRGFLFVLSEAKWIDKTNKIGNIYRIVLNFCMCALFTTRRKKEMERSVKERVVSVVAKQFGIQESEIVREARFREDFGIDSLDEIELALELSEEFDVSIPDEDAVGLLTVGDAIDYITKKAPAPE